MCYGGDSAAKREKERRNSAFITSMELLRAAETEHNRNEGLLCGSVEPLLELVCPGQEECP